MSELRIAVSEVRPGEPVRLDGGPGGVCLVRIGDDYHAIGDLCTHADVSLAEGEVDVDTRCVECWMHGSEFSLVDGRPQSLPATRAVPVYAVTVDGDDVVVSR